MVVASSFPCYIGRFKKVDVVTRALGYTESIPGRDSVAANLAFLDCSFQHAECIFQAAAEDIVRDIGELRFWIVHMKQVDRLESQIVTGTLDLIFQKSGRHAMHSPGQLLEIENAGLDILAPEVSPRIGGHVAVKREISRLGADQDFIPLQFPDINQLPECCADIALGALVPVVNSRVQNIDAGA